jgi:tetratricopeptide (TPR) repeat protein
MWHFKSLTMKRILQTFLYALIFITSFGQTELKPQFDKATDYLNKKDYKNAIKEFSAILDKATETKVKKFAFIYRGFAKNGLSDFTSAIADFDKAVELDPNDLGTYIDRGQSKIYANNYEAAIKDFEFVLTKDSVNKQGQNALFYLANIAYKAGEFELSIKYYDKLILLTPEDFELYFNRGVSKGMIMDSQGSIKDYDKAIELKPDYKEAYANRGVAKINLLTTKGNIKPTKEQTKDACSDLKKAKQLGDNTVDDMIFIHCGK